MSLLPVGCKKAISDKKSDPVIVVPTALDTTGILTYSNGWQIVNIATDHNGNGVIDSGENLPYASFVSIRTFRGDGTAADTAVFSRMRTGLWSFLKNKNEFEVYWDDPMGKDTESHSIVSMTDTTLELSVYSRTNHTPPKLYYMVKH